MKSSRMEILQNQQTSTARKVLEAAPLREWWTPAQVLGELKRLGVQSQLSVVEGCLKSLKHTGLVQSSDGRYQRIKIAEEEDTMPTEKSVARAAAQSLFPNALEATTPIQVVKAAAADLRRQAAHLIQVADAMELSVMEIEERLQLADQRAAKTQGLEKLAAALKEAMG